MKALKKMIIFGSVLFILALPMLTRAALYDDGYEWRGVITARPVGTVGTWSIGGQNFEATQSTYLEAYEHGPLAVGGCAEVKYYSTSNSRIATKISSEEAYKCGGQLPPSSTSVPNPEMPDSSSPIGQPINSYGKYYGFLVSNPSNWMGVWVIGGQSFNASATTRFEQSHGRGFVTGACIEVEYYAGNGLNEATEIKTSDDGYHCNNVGSPPVPGSTPAPYSGQFYGVVNSQPANLIGQWSIGGQIFTTNAATRFEQNNGVLAVGTCAEVKYYISNGVNIASEISRDQGYHCGGQPVVATGTPTADNGTSPHLGSYANKVYASVAKLPIGSYVGVWNIGGVDYTASELTEIEMEHGAITVGSCVEARYYVSASAINVLTEVQSKASTRCQNSAPGAQTLLQGYGAVDSFPGTWVGTWRIGGVAYEGNAQTIFRQENGAFSVGGFIEITYYMSGTTRIATKIDSHIAPRTGDENGVGILGQRPTDDRGMWMINGVTYQGDAAIEVNLKASTPLLQKIAPNLQSSENATQQVLFTAYQLNGVRYITYSARSKQVYTPMLKR